MHFKKYLYFHSFSFASPYFQVIVFFSKVILCQNKNFEIYFVYNKFYLHCSNCNITSILPHPFASTFESWHSNICRMKTSRLKLSHCHEIVHSLFKAMLHNTLYIYIYILIIYIYIFIHINLFSIMRERKETDVSSRVNQTVNKIAHH